MITQVKGKIFERIERGNFSYLLHGCNCFHTMGAGIARDTKERNPEALQADKLTL